VFEPVDASSTYEETVTRLGTAIRIGVLPPGAKLPPERDLAEQLGISRSTLRQALATLTASGHLTAVRGRLGGTFVAEEPPLTSPRPVAREQWRAVLDWRLALELGIVQLAAERASDDDRAKLAEAFDQLEETLTADFATYRRADIAFHLALAESARSNRLIAEMTQLQGALSDLLDQLELPQDARERANDQHRAVLAAVQDGDPARALAEMRSHLGATESLVDDAL
jgi:GntR family transcriptional regulator, transcriptional repressor for pyruvate dehydrogenase complex